MIPEGVNKKEYLDKFKQIHDEVWRGEWADGESPIEEVRKRWAAVCGVAYKPRMPGLGVRLTPVPTAPEDKVEDRQAAQARKSSGRREAKSADG